MEPKINLLLVLSISCSPGVLADKIYMRRAKALDGASGYIYSSDSALTPQFAELDTRSYPALTAGKFDELAPFTTEGYGESSEQLINNAGLNSIVYAGHTPIEFSHAPIIDKGGLEYANPLENFSKRNGANYETSNKNTNDLAEQIAYNKKDEFSTGSVGSHSNENHKGYQAASGGDKGKYGVEQAGYEEKESRDGGHSGGEYYDKNDHKNRSRTKGYRKVYHKDEYKKDHSFYERSHKKGSFNKYGDFESSNSAKEGEYKNGDRAASSYAEKQNANKGSYDEGKYSRKDNGSGGVAEHNKFYNNFYEGRNDGRSQNKIAVIKEAN